jgi:hypothetical protein
MSSPVVSPLEMSSLDEPKPKSPVPNPKEDEDTPTSSSFSRLESYRRIFKVENVHDLDVLIPIQEYTVKKTGMKRNPRWLFSLHAVYY